MHRTLLVFAISAVVLLLPAPLGARQAVQSVASLEAAAKEADAAGRTKEAFDLYVRAVQALPDLSPVDDDVRLRGHAIRVAALLQPPPGPPEEAVRLQIRGQVLLKDAKNEAALEEAAAELRKAVRAAPWVADYAYNLALVQEKLEYYRAAAANLKLYVASPTASDVDAARAKIYEFELRAERNKDAAMKEACAFGDRRACGDVAYRNAPRFAVWHDSVEEGRGLLTVFGGVEFIEDASGKASHSFTASCQDIKEVKKGTFSTDGRLAGGAYVQLSTRRSGNHFFYTTAYSNFDSQAIRRAEYLAHSKEWSQIADALAAAITAACPQVSTRR